MFGDDSDEDDSDEDEMDGVEGGRSFSATHGNWRAKIGRMLHQV